MEKEKQENLEMLFIKAVFEKSLETLKEEPQIDVPSYLKGMSDVAYCVLSLFSSLKEKEIN